MNGRSRGVKRVLVAAGLFFSAPALAEPYTCYFGKDDRSVISTPFETLAGEVEQVSYFRTNVQETGGNWPFVDGLFVGKI